MNIEKKFYVTNYVLQTSRLKSTPTKLLVASDIHYHKHVNKTLFNLLLKYVVETKPDFIIMPGDQIETIDFIDDEKEKEFFENIILTMSKIAPIIIIPGNHEIKDFNISYFKDRLKESSDDNKKAMDYFELLGKNKNVFFLNNTSIKIDGITFYGFNPRLGSYQRINDEKTTEEFIEDYLRTGFKMEESEYNILITHSPLQLYSERVQETLQDLKNSTDLIITGHMHDGYLPKFFDSRIKNKNVGLFITPLIAPIPGILCRGVHKYGRGYLCISQGFRKWTTDLLVTNTFESITANDLECLELTNSNDEEAISFEETKPFVKKIKSRKRT